MAIKLSGNDVILADGMNANDALMLAFNRIDSNRYVQPQFGNLAGQATTINANTYEEAQYVSIPFTTYTRFNNHAQNVIGIEDGHLVTYDNYRYFLFYSFHINVQTPSAANVDVIDLYQRLVFASDNQSYVATGRERSYLPKFLSAANYLYDSNKNGYFTFLTQPDNPIDFQVYLSSPASQYKFERVNFLYIAIPLEME